MTVSQINAQTIENLRRQIGRLEGLALGPRTAAISSGCPALDAILPARGLRPGTLSEWLAVGPGAGAATLALGAAREACRQGGALVVLDRAGEFYPPAAVARGIALSQLLLVRARSPADDLWALDQALRCPGVAAALAWTARLDPKTFRRLQLAAEAGGGLGLLLRPEGVRPEPSWADVRLLVAPLPTAAADGRRLRITVLRCRGGGRARSVDVELGHDSHPLSLDHLRTAAPQPGGSRRA